jgi:hypothetical protein
VARLAAGSTKEAQPPDGDGDTGHNDRMPDLGYFTPYRAESPARARGCLTCTHFHGQFYCGHVLCERDRAALRRWRAGARVRVLDARDGGG